MTAIYVEQPTMEAVRGHAATRRGRFEVGGALVLQERLGNTFAVDYLPVENTAVRPGEFNCAAFRFQLPPGRRAIELHTHPGIGATSTPTNADIDAMLELGRELFAIYQPERDELAVWKVTARDAPNGKPGEDASVSDYQAVPVVILKPWVSRRSRRLVNAVE